MNSRKDAFKKMFSDYIMVQAEIALAMGIIGSIFVPDEKIPYSYFFLPAILGVICMLPCIITYFKEDMTIKQIMIQRIAELIVLEIAIIGIIYGIVGDTLGKLGYVAMFFSILFFDILSYSLSFYLEKKEADIINEKLKENKILREKGEL